MITLDELFIKKEALIKEKIFLEAKISVVDDFIAMEQAKVETEIVESEESEVEFADETC